MTDRQTDRHGHRAIAYRAYRAVKTLVLMSLILVFQ